MSDFPIPHIPPIRFVQSLLFADESNAQAKVEFPHNPTFGMMVEAAAQASSGILDNDKEKIQKGFLVTLKNIQLLEELQSKQYIFEIQLDSKIANFKYFSFNVLDNDKSLIMKGSFSIALEK